MSSLAENLEKKLQSYLEGGLTEAVLKAEADTNKRLDDSIQKVLGGLKIEIHPCPHVFKDGRKCGHYGFEKFKVLNPETGEWEWYCKSTHKSMAVEKYKVSQKFSDELAAQKKENEILKNQLRQKRDREDELAKKRKQQEHHDTSSNAPAQTGSTTSTSNTTQSATSQTQSTSISTQQTLEKAPESPKNSEGSDVGGSPMSGLSGVEDIKGLFEEK